MSVVAKYWNEDKQQSSVVKAYRDDAKINFETARWRRAIDAAIARIEENDITIDNAKQFWEYVEAETTGVAPRTKSAITFLEYWDTVFIRRFMKTKSDTRIRRFEVILHKLRNFEMATGKQYGFDDVDLSFYRALQIYM